MIASKTLSESRTIWANVIGLVALLLGYLGFDVTGLDAGPLAEAVAQIVAAGSFIASTVFRILATKQILA